MRCDTAAAPQQLPWRHAHNTQITAASSLRSGIAVIADTSLAAMRGPGVDDH